MEDDNLAHNAGQLIELLDVFLKDSRLMAALTPTEILLLRIRRQQMVKALAAYRMFSGYTERRRSEDSVVPFGPYAGVSMPIAIARTTATLAKTAARGGAVVHAATLLEVAYVAGLILLPLASAAILSELMGGPLAASAGRGLLALTKRLANELSALEELMGMAATALTEESVRQLSKADLLKLIGDRAVNTALNIDVLIKELLRRFPRCAQSIESLHQAIRGYRKAKVADKFFGYQGSGLPNRTMNKAKATALEQLLNAWDTVSACINRVG